MRDISGLRSVKRTRASIEPLYRDAEEVSDLRSILEPRPGRGSRVLSNVRADALVRISELAETIEWKRVHCATSAAAFALALCEGDPVDPAARLKAMISRAYLSADRYAAAFAQRVADGTYAGADAIAIKEALDLLLGSHERPIVQFLEGDGPLQRSLELVSRWRRRGESSQTAAARKEGLTDALRTIELVQEILERGSDSLPGAQGVVSDEPRLFFVLRLAEAVAATTSVTLYFSDHYHKRVSNTWGELVRAALSIAGLSGGDRTIDGLLRRLRRYEHGLAALSAAYSGSPSKLDRPYHHGDMSSTGLEGDYSLPAVASWDEG